MKSTQIYTNTNLYPCEKTPWRMRDPGRRDRTGGQENDITVSSDSNVRLQKMWAEGGGFRGFFRSCWFIIRVRWFDRKWKMFLSFKRKELQVISRSMCSSLLSYKHGPESRREPLGTNVSAPPPWRRSLQDPCEERRLGRVYKRKGHKGTLKPRGDPTQRNPITPFWTFDLVLTKVIFPQGTKTP